MCQSELIKLISLEGFLLPYVHNHFPIKLCNKMLLIVSAARYFDCNLRPTGEL